MTTLLRLVHPDQDDPHWTTSKDPSMKDPSVKDPSVKGHWMTDQKWTAWDICDGRLFDIVGFSRCHLCLVRVV